MLTARSSTEPHKRRTFRQIRQGYRTGHRLAESGFEHDRLRSYRRSHAQDPDPLDYTTIASDVILFARHT